MIKRIKDHLITTVIGSVIVAIVCKDLYLYYHDYTYLNMVISMVFLTFGVALILSKDDFIFSFIDKLIK